MKRLLFASLVLAVLSLTPVTARAETIGNTGFVPGAVWLAHSPVYAHEAVQLYTVIFNGSGQTISGIAEFFDGTSPIGSQNFSMSADTHTKELSIAWTPTAGEHTLSVKLRDTSFARGSETVPALPAYSTGQTTKVTTIIRPTASSTIEIITRTISPVVIAAESARTELASYLDSIKNSLQSRIDAASSTAPQQTASPTATTPTRNKLGFISPNAVTNPSPSTNATKPFTIPSPLSLISPESLLAALGVLDSLVSTPMLFYPVLFLAILIIVRLLFRAMNRHE